MRSYQLREVCTAFAAVLLICVGCNPSISPEATSVPANLEPIPTETTLLLTQTATPTIPEVNEVIDRSNISRLHMSAVLKMKGNPDYLRRYGTIFQHGNEIWAADPISEDAIRIINLETGDQIARISTDEGFEIRLLITDPEGEMLAAVSPATDQITIWSLSTFHEVGLLDFPGFISPNPVYDAYQIIGAISPDRHYLAVSGCRIAGNPLCLRADLILYDLNSLSTLYAFSGWQRFTRSIAFHPSQEILVFAGEGESVLRGDIILWDINHAKRLAMVDINEFSNVIEVRYDPTGKYLAVAGSFRDSLREHSKSLQLYDVHSWKITPCELSDQYYASVITFLPGSEMIITGGLGMNFWDLDDCTHRYLNPSLGSSTLEIGVKSDETIIYTMNSSEAAVWAVID